MWRLKTMELKGYVKIHRKILDWKWWHDANVFRLFFYILAKANWKDSEFEDIIVERGSLVTSYEKLAAGTGLSVRQVRTALDKLESTGEIEKNKNVRGIDNQMTNERHTKKYTFIRVCNYDKYQERLSNDNQMTFERLSNDFQMTTNEEYKEYKEIKEECVVGEADTQTRTISSSQSKPSLDDVKAFVSDKKLKVSPDRFFYYYEARDWKDRSGQEITNWKMALMGWNAMPTHEEQVAGSDDGWLE